MNAPTPSFLTDEQAGRLILHNSKDSFVLVNPQLSIVYYNKAAREGVRRFLGIDLFPGMNFLELTSEDRREVVKGLCNQVLLGQKHQTEVQFTVENGTTVFYENSFVPAYDTNNEIVGIISSSIDITDQKRTQQVVRESEQRLQFALEAAAQGAWDWDLLTNEVVYSESYKKLYGFEENELKNHVSEWITRIHPDDSKKMQSSVAEHLQSIDPEYDSRYRILAKDGTYRWIMAKGRLVSFDEQGKPLRMIGTHTDITESVEREKALNSINERFDCMVKATHELLWEWDIESNQVDRAKEGLKSVYGINDDTAIQNVEKWLECVHPEDQSGVRNWLADILNGAHQQTFEFEYRFRRDDGEYAFIYDRCILLKDENNKPVKLIGAAQDISERKRLERELLTNELAYQRLIHQATVDSQEKERAEIGKELHDNVNQVLTTTKLYLDLATANSELKEELIRKSILNINNVIQEIRLLSRSLMDPSIGDLGLLESIRDLADNVHLTQKLAIQFKAECCIEERLNATQKLTVFRIIQECLNNVLRHAKAKTMWIEMRIDGNDLHLQIKDDGVGFEQTTMKKGAGLKNIQNRSYLINGTLRIESQLTKGSLLHLKFPI